MGILSNLARDAIGSAGRAAGRSVARGSERGATKQALKDQYMEAGMTEVQATNRANYDFNKAAGKPTSLEKMEVKQDRDTSSFVSPRDQGGSETLQLARRDTTTGRKVATNSPYDTAVRSVAKRQDSRAKGEAMYEAGLNEELGRRGITAATVATAAGAAAKKVSDDNEKSKESSKESKKEKSSSDERTNKEDFPVYKKGTESADTFQKAFKEAKKDGKDSFSFEGRKYNTKEEKKDSKDMNKGGMVKGYAKGGYVNCGASVPPAQKKKK
jgi:hypothetical protein